MARNHIIIRIFKNSPIRKVKVVLDFMIRRLVPMQRNVSIVKTFAIPLKITEQE